MKRLTPLTNIYMIILVNEYEFYIVRCVMLKTFEWLRMDGNDWMWN